MNPLTEVEYYVLPSCMTTFLPNLQYYIYSSMLPSIDCYNHFQNSAEASFPFQVPLKSLFLSTDIFLSPFFYHYDLIRYPYQPDAYHCL